VAAGASRIGASAGVKILQAGEVAAQATPAVAPAKTY